MKRILILAAIALAPRIGYCVEVFGDSMANEPALTYDVNYDRYVDSMVDKKVSAVMAYSIATIPTNTFTDGRLASGTVVVAATTSLRNEYITVNGYKFVGSESNVIGDKAGNYDSAFSISGTVYVAALNLSYVIRNHPGLSSILNVSTSGATITLTSIYADGKSYALTTSSPALLTLSGATMTGAIAADIDTSTNTITATAHGLTTGEGVTYSTGTNGTITGLTNATVYYIIRVTADKYAFASTKVGATSGTRIDISFTPGATAHTFTLSPVVWGSSTASAKWRQSNDGTNFYDIPSISAMAMTSGTTATVTGWDFGWFNFKWLRLAVTGPSTGGINLKTDLNVKQ